MYDRSGIAQIALSTMDGQRSRDWYVRGLGYQPAGARQPTSDLSAVQGLPDATLRELLWLVDANAFFQIEIFRYASPPVRPQPPDRRACDIGYAGFGVWVADFDATVHRLSELGSPPLSAPVGPAGGRRVCVLDPDGVIVEVMEDRVPTPGQALPARPGAPVATRSVTVSVPDLHRSLRYFADAIGLTPTTDVALHTVEHEALWCLAGAKARRALLAAGDLWLELVQYTDPVGRPRPAGYRISDQGILNIAVTSRTMAGYRAVRDRVVAAGYRVHAEIARDRLHIQYTESDDGFSVELAYFDEALDAVQGFRPEDSSSATGR
jgi:catechol 2,3-dioxygenase-like lactoylglutathione lyase family enzyme